jgi:hypothetical protein
MRAMRKLATGESITADDRLVVGAQLPPKLELGIATLTRCAR